MTKAHHTSLKSCIVQDLCISPEQAENLLLLCQLEELAMTNPAQHLALLCETSVRGEGGEWSSRCRGCEQLTMLSPEQSSADLKQFI